MPMFRNPFTNAGRNQDKGAPGNPQDKLTISSGVVPEKDKPDPDKDPKKKENHDSLLDFEQLWQPNLDKDGKVIAKPGPKRFTPNVDPKVFAAMMEKVDFTKSLTPEDFEGVKKGGDEAVGSLMLILNKVAKQGFATNFAAMQQMVERSVQAARQDALSEVPGFVKEQMVESELSRDNPLMENPAYKPMVDHIRKQFQDKYPKASAADINKGVRAYFDTMVADSNTAKEKATKKEPTNEELLRTGADIANWEDWFGDEIPDLQTSGASPTEGDVTQGTVTQQ